LKESERNTISIRLKNLLVVIVIVIGNIISIKGIMRIRKIMSNIKPNIIIIVVRVNSKNKEKT
jgi:hypothetical protein